MGYVAKVGAKRLVVIDGAEGKLYEDIQNPAFSSDSQRVAYVAKVGGKDLPVIDGVEGKRYDGVWELSFSPDSRRVAYVAKSGEKKYFAVIDGMQGKTYDSIGSVLIIQEGGPIHLFPNLKFSPDSQHVAYRASLGRKCSIVVDSRQGRDFDCDSFREIKFDSAREFHYLSRSNASKTSTNAENYDLYSVEETIR
jgi:hypothetical protein